MASLRFIRNLSLETKKWSTKIDKNIETHIDKNSVIFYKKPNKCIIPITQNILNTPIIPNKPINKENQKNKHITESNKCKYTYDKNILLYILFCCGGVGSAGFGVSMVYGYILYDDISTLFL